MLYEAYTQADAFLTGIWPIVAKFGIAGFATLACLVFAWFSPIFKKTALWIALAIVVYVFSYASGVKDGSDRVQAQWDAAIEQALKTGQKARSDAEHYDAGTTPDELRLDPYNRDNRSSSGPTG